MGTGLFNVKPTMLTTASGEYTKAARAYSSALGDLTKALDKVDALWEDSAKETWNERLKKALLDFKNLEIRLDRNANVISQIAEAAQKTETNVGSRIGQL